MRSKTVLAYSLLFFLSGATGLVYQLLWVRVLYQSFGSTIQSITTVVAAYMGGLGLGAWLFGRIADRSRRPAALYGWLEIAIGIFGIVSPLVLSLAHSLYLGLGGGGVALRFGLAALVLLVPTTLMGATLPVLTRAFMEEDRTRLKPSLGRLYGVNTLGAVVGTALAGFFLIEFIGVRVSLWLTAATNLGIGAVALWFGRSPSPTDPGRQPGENRSPPRDLIRTLALILLGVTAFASLLNEIAWTRVLVMIVGGSTYAFTLVLVVFLLGIGLGSVIVARRSGPRADTAASAALAQGLTGVGAAALFLFFGLLPVYIIAVFQIPDLGATPRLLLMGVAVGAVVLVPALGMGMTFPLLTDLTARPDAARGTDVGAAYALNTVGSILGAVLTGFVLVVAWGTQTTLRAGLAINGLAALALAWAAARGIAEGSADDRRLRVRVLGAGVLGVLALLAAAAAPGWSTRLIDLGPTIYARTKMDAAQRQAFLEHRGTRQLAFKEGWNATVSVWENETGRSLRVNGKVDASDRGDMGTQIMVGLAPVAARPGATSALVIGYGSGVTARVLADVPGMTRVRVIEIEPAVLAMDTLFRHVNGGVLRRPGVTAVVDDARSALQLHAERFDVIMSEPSNPWVAGIATLYTPEFFRIVRSRLADDGVFCQWVQLYQLPLPIVAGIVRNVQEVFPHVEVWFGESHDLMVVASARPIVYDTAWVARLVGPRGALGELGREWLNLDTPDQFFGRRLVGSRGVGGLVERARFEHRDDRPRLEFVAARRFLDPGTTAAVVFDSLAQIGLAGGDAAPLLLLARTLAERRTDAGVLPYVEALRRAEPDSPEWSVRAASIRLGLGDTVVAGLLLTGVLAQGRAAGGSWGDAMLLSGVISTARREPPRRARAFALGALAGGADTAQARAVLALLAVRDSSWAVAGVEARGALAAARGTFRHPFPAQFLGEVLTSLALDGPPALADNVLEYAVQRRPAAARYRELRAIAALRTGRCEVAAAGFVDLLDFGIERKDAPALVRECWATSRRR
jgi:predicted membrane-bound spermidine synthase